MQLLKAEMASAFLYGAVDRRALFAAPSAGSVSPSPDRKLDDLSLLGQ
jgi:hypothetical protein